MKRGRTVTFRLRVRSGRISRSVSMLGLCPLSMYIVDMYRVDFSTFDVVLVGYIHIQIQIHITIIIRVR